MLAGWVAIEVDLTLVFEVGDHLGEELDLLDLTLFDHLVLGSVGGVAWSDVR